MTAAAKILPPEVINGDSSWSLPTIAARSQHEQARELPPSTHQRAHNRAANITVPLENTSTNQLTRDYA
jgi:hypothetical protein